MSTLSRLLTAVLLLLALWTSSGTAAKGAGAMPASPQETDSAPAAATLPARGAGRSEAGGTAVAPPGTGDVDRPHADPGAWPEVIFVVALFTFALVLRGSRGRRRPPGPADRRRR